MCLCDKPACMYVHHVHTMPTVPEEITGSPETPCGCCEMQEQQVLFIFMCMGALFAYILCTLVGLVKAQTRHQIEFVHSGRVISSAPLLELLHFPLKSSG